MAAPRILMMLKAPFSTITGRLSPCRCSIMAKALLELCMIYDEIKKLKFAWKKLGAISLILPSRESVMICILMIMMVI